MSELWLVLAMVGTFLTVFLVGVIVDMAMRERHRPITILESQVGSLDTHDFAERPLEGSAIDRIFLPIGKRLSQMLVSLTPIDLKARIQRKLVLAGSPARWDAERIVALKIVFGLAGVIGGSVLAGFLPLPPAFRVGFVVLLGLVGYIAPSYEVSVMATKRQNQIRRQLADVMDLLTISVEAGLGFDAAMAQVIRNVPGPLAEEMGRLLQEIQLGVSRAEAFRHVGERTEVEELRAFVLAMVQADLFGVSIANVLRAQSKELRNKRRQRAEEQAQKIPTKLLFPMIFMILPALFIVIMGPGILQIYDTFFGG